MFTIGESRTNSHPTQNCKQRKCLQILAEEDFPLKLLWRTPIKIHRRADWRRQPRSREHRAYGKAEIRNLEPEPETETETETETEKETEPEPEPKPEPKK